MVIIERQIYDALAVGGRYPGLGTKMSKSYCYREQCNLNAVSSMWEDLFVTTVTVMDIDRDNGTCRENSTNFQTRAILFQTTEIVLHMRQECICIIAVFKLSNYVNTNVFDLQHLYISSEGTSIFLVFTWYTYYTSFISNVQCPQCVKWALILLTN